MRSVGHSNLRFIKVKEEDKVEIFMTHITMTEETTETDIDLIVVTGKINMDRIGLDQDMNKIIGQKILEATQGLIKILEDRIVENTGLIIGMKIMVEAEVGVGLGKGHFQEITISVEGTIKSISNSRSKSG